MFNKKKQTKDFKTLTSSFTQAFTEYAKEQQVLAASQEAIENNARKAKLVAVNEQSLAERAALNIKNLLTGGANVS